MSESSIPNRLGFIGVGAIAEAVITGLMESGFPGHISVSPRNQHRVSALATRFERLTVETGNPEVVDRCDWVFLAVLPDQAPRVLSELKFRKTQSLISLVAGIDRKRLRQLAAPVDEVFRLIPLPPVEFSAGPLPLFPPSSAIRQLFQACGEVIEVEQESQMAIFSAASGLMASHHELTARLAGWMSDQGMPSAQAATYASSLFRSLTEVECRVSAERLVQLADDSSTPGGLNEQALQELRSCGWFERAMERLDRLYRRVQQGL